MIPSSASVTSPTCNGSGSCPCTAAGALRRRTRATSRYRVRWSIFSPALLRAHVIEVSPLDRFQGVERLPEHPLIRRRPVERRDGNVVEPQVDGQLGPVVNEMVEGSIANRDVARLLRHHMAP